MSASLRPTARLDVAGQIHSATFDNAASLTVNWDNGNNQHMSPAACGAIAMTNMLDGGRTTLAVQGVTSGTCSFSQSGLSFVYSPANASVTSDAVYNFVRLGTTVYVTWSTGYTP